MKKRSIGVTASHLFHKGYVYNSDLERANLALGASTKLSIGINVSGNFSYTRADSMAVSLARTRLVVLPLLLPVLYSLPATGILIFLLKIQTVCLYNQT